MTGIAIPADPADPAAVAAYEDVLRAAARDFADNAISNNTERAYDAAWRSFTGFTAALGRSALPAEPQTVADYVAHLALQGRKASTIRAYLTAIAVRHRASGHESPTEHGVVRSVTKGMRRALGVAPQKKDALLRDELLAAAAAIPDDLRGLRDRAVLLIGWSGAFRRSEIAAIDVADLGFAPENYRDRPPSQDGSGSRRGVRRDPTDH